MYRKKKVNTGITRIFRQHKFLEFRNLNVYDENPNSNFDFWYLFLFYEVVAESKITLWMDIRIIGIVGKLKPDILKADCHSIHGPIERNYNDWNGPHLQPELRLLLPESPGQGFHDWRWILVSHSNSLRYTYTATNHRASLSGEKLDQILFLRENA